MIDDKQQHPQWDHMKKTDIAERQIVASRSERNQRKKRKSVNEEESSGKRRIWVQIRLLPIWLRVVLVLLLITGAAVVGAIIGYGYVGDGVPSDVLKKETWTHILDIINGKES